MKSLDLTQEALDALRPSKAANKRPPDHDEARRLRNRLLGVLIRRRRLEAECAIADCADFMGTPPALIEAWEFGERAPSLPQVEMLSQFFNGSQAAAVGDDLTEAALARAEYILLRRRLIGALLRAARLSMGASADDLSQSSGLDANQLERYELGEEMLPLSDLIALAQALSADLNDFAPQSGLARAPSKAKESRAAETEGKSEWRQFAADGENLPFIRLAMAFQHIARDDLHRIADALFAIIRANGDSSLWSGASS